jgi:hypothetical protein
MPITIQTMRGMWDLQNPKPAHVSGENIAMGLARISRFNGIADQADQYAGPGQRWTVLKHSILVGDILACRGFYEAVPYGYLHDAHEFVLGDKVTPIKQLLRLKMGDAFDHAWREITDAHDSAIFQSFGLKYPMPPEIKTGVKEADLVALAIERRDLLPNYGDEFWDLPEPDHTLSAHSYKKFGVGEFISRLWDSCPEYPSARGCGE